MYKILSVGVLALSALAMTGCDSGPSVEPVTGSVTLDGQAIAGATVSFSPAPGSTGSAAVGKTDSSGKYTLSDMNATSIGGGAKVGDYNVAVQWYKPSNPSSASATGDSGGGETTDLGDTKAARSGVTGPEALLPTPYTDPTTSGLTVTVAKGPNVYDIPLDSNFKGAGN